MDGDNHIEQALFKILDFQVEHKVDDDSILIMLSLLNLMGLVNVLNRQGESSAAGAGPAADGPGNMAALLGPLLALMASGMGKGGAAGGGQSSFQSPFNPAMLLSLLGGGLGGGPGGGQGKGGASDLSALLGLLGPLLGLGGNFQTPGQFSGQSPGSQSVAQAGGTWNGCAAKPPPVQREINLDEKFKTAATGTPSPREKERPPGPGEVLKWKFGT